MKNWFAKAAALLIRPMRAAQARLLDGPQLAKCRSCGKRQSIAGMSEIPFHGYFCNDDEAAKYWNKNYELKTAGEPVQFRHGAETDAPRLSQPSGSSHI